MVQILYKPAPRQPLGSLPRAHLEPGQHVRKVEKSLNDEKYENGLNAHILGVSVGTTCFPQPYHPSANDDEDFL